MNFRQIAMPLLLLLLIIPSASAQSKLLRKIQERTEEEVINELFGDKKKNSPSGEQPASQNSSGLSGSDYSGSESSGSGLSNTRGGGLTTPPDVAENINSASAAFSKGNLNAARNAVQQAILGVEMEIGQNILKTLPAEIKGLKAQTEEDKVSSMSIGFVGLVIERVYRNDDQQLKVSIGNDAAMLTAANMYLSGSYSTGPDQNFKQVSFQGQKGVLQYDESSGYNLSVPFGQSSVYVAEGINFANEDEILAAANEINLETIKKELGEQ